MGACSLRCPSEEVIPSISSIPFVSSSHNNDLSENANVGLATGHEAEVKENISHKTILARNNRAGYLLYVPQLLRVRYSQDRLLPEGLCWASPTNPLFFSQAEPNKEYRMQSAVNEQTLQQIECDLVEFNSKQSAVEIQKDEESPSSRMMYAWSWYSDYNPVYVGTKLQRQAKVIGHFQETFPLILGHRLENDDESKFAKHDQLQKEMNLYQEQCVDDILNRNMPQKNNVNDRWNVVGLIDPDKHLSTVIIPNIEFPVSDDIVNYHHWIPTVFQVNHNATECQLLSQIPNLDPYRNRDTLYPLITELFLHQIPQFERVLDLKLRNVPLKVVVKAQDYQLTECKEENAYLGNMHKEGLYEDIAAVGLYYYQIDDGILGGDLEVSSVIAVSHGGHFTDRYFTELKHATFELSEGTSLVFRNDYCYHRVSQLHGNGSRKIIAFFLLRDSAVHSFDARDVAVNVKHHATYFVKQLLREMEEDGNLWLIQLVQEYVVGNRAYISKALDVYRDCRNAQSYQIQTQRNEIERPMHYRCNPLD